MAEACELDKRKIGARGGLGGENNVRLDRGSQARLDGGLHGVSSATASRKRSGSGCNGVGGGTHEGRRRGACGRRVLRFLAKDSIKDARRALENGDGGVMVL